MPSDQEALKYNDWAKMVSGLMDDTPLGRIVSIRSEKDPEIIKGFSKGQKEIQAEWASFRASQKNHEVNLNDQFKQLEKMIAGFFGG